MSHSFDARDDARLPAAVAAAVAELHSEPAPVASEALLARIQRSRADGVRGLLPVSDGEAAEEAPSTWTVRTVLVAAGVAAMAAISVWRPASPAGPARDTANVASRDSMATVERATGPAAPTMAMWLSPWPRVAYAQTPKGGRPGPHAALTGLDPARVLLGRRGYMRLSASPYHDLLPHEFYEVDVDTTRLDGLPAWRLVTRERARQALKVTLPEWRHDTLWLDRRTFRPLVRRYRNAVLHMRQQFTDSSLVEVDSMAVPSPTKRPFRFGVTKVLDRSRLFVANEAMLRVLLQASPLSATWRASVGVLDGDRRPFAQGTATYRNLRVAGVDTVQTFSGRYVAWRVEVETGAEPERWYVSQESGEVLLSRGPFDPVTYPRSESHLVSGFSETRRVVPVRR